MTFEDLTFLCFTSGWTTSSADAVRQLQPIAQPQHNQRLGKSISSPTATPRQSPIGGDIRGSFHAILAPFNVCTFA